MALRCPFNFSLHPTFVSALPGKNRTHALCANANTGAQTLFPFVDSQVYV